MARITGKVTEVEMFTLPPDAEVLGMEGKQVWYADPDGLGSGTMTDITSCFVPGSLQIGSSEECEES